MGKQIVVEVAWTESAGDSLREIGSRTLQKKIRDKVESLRASGQPELLGKPLDDEMQGLYRISYGQYRIIYRVVRDSRNPDVIRIVIRVILAGIRKEGDKRDIYERLRRMLRRGEL